MKRLTKIFLPIIFILILIQFVVPNWYYRIDNGASKDFYNLSRKVNAFFWDNSMPDIEFSFIYNKYNFFHENMTIAFCIIVVSFFISIIKQNKILLIVVSVLNIIVLLQIVLEYYLVSKYNYQYCETFRPTDETLEPSCNYVFTNCYGLYYTVILVAIALFLSILRYKQKYCLK